MCQYNLIITVYWVNVGSIPVDQGSEASVNVGKVWFMSIVIFLE